MKIDPQKNVYRVNDQPDTKTTHITDSKNFEEMFKSSLSRAEQDGKTDSIAPLPAQPCLSGPTIVPFSRTQILNKEQLVEKTENLLKVLEGYALKLEDSTVDMHDVHPLINTLKRESELLNVQLNQLDDDDELKTILGDVLQTAVGELTRFENGDYVSLEKRP